MCANSPLSTTHIHYFQGDISIHHCHEGAAMRAYVTVGLIGPFSEVDRFLQLLTWCA